MDTNGLGISRKLRNGSVPRKWRREMDFCSKKHVSSDIITHFEYPFARAASSAHISFDAYRDTSAARGQKHVFRDFIISTSPFTTGARFLYLGTGSIYTAFIADKKAIHISDKIILDDNNAHLFRFDLASPRLTARRLST